MIDPRRLDAQLLSGPPAAGPVAVAERLLAIQGQDPRGARLAVRARTTGLSAAAVDRALTTERTLAITWLNRGTLHLVRREDYGWLHALTAPPQLTGNTRRLAQEGVAPAAAERAVGVIARSLAEDGPLTRNQLGERIAAAGVRTAGQALVHLLGLASLRGLILRGPMVGAQHAYALVSDWFGDVAPVDRDRALAELARRYLAGHGPADDRDLANWAGLPLRDARAGLAAIGSELDGRPGPLVDLAGRPPEAAAAGAATAPPRLLGAFDPVLLGWRSREPVLGRHEPVIVSGGVFRPFALVRGEAAAAWKLAAGRVVIEPFAPAAPADARALEADAREVERYLGARWSGGRHPPDHPSPTGQGSTR